MKSLAILLFIVSSFAFAKANDYEVNKGIYENLKGGSPTAYTIFKKGNDNLKIEVSPDLSSHYLLITGFYSKNNQLTSITIEMWNLLDDEANRLTEPTLHSLVIHEVREDKIISSSSEEENMYMKKSGIVDYFRVFESR